MTQDSENWQQLQALFHLIEGTLEEHRERVLAEHCSDPGLQRRVMAIFRGSNVEVPSADRVPSALTGKIGPYSMIKHLGSGGIGSVYLVERMVGGAVQRSALKVLGPHAAGDSFVERFHREQHILASLDHPNITRMLDAGLTERDQPYLVMEYVDGVHLDHYCDTSAMGITERLRLFLHVGDAVAYAHRNLVVHLDLKPSNILVTSEGVVKLLDFGTSKLIEPDSLLTTTIMATPAYASPEQLRNEPVTTACDIYALGAVLFELLAGRRPGDKASMPAMIERAMKELEPENLPDAVTEAAAARRGLTEALLLLMLKGDLATIVSKCLRPRPMDRYPSVDLLMSDIHRFLTGRPVLARPQTTAYRLSKFVRRNQKTLAAGVLIAIALFAALIYAEWRQRQAVLEGQRALRMQTFMYSLFKLANSNYTGKSAATVPEFLKLGVKILPDYIKDPADLRRAQMSLGESMYDNGDLDDARSVFAQTIASATPAKDVEAEAESEAFAGNIDYLQGRMESGQALTARALKLSRQAGMSPAVRVWSAIYYAWNRDNNGFRDDENLRLLRYAVNEARINKLSVHETADAIYDLGSDLELRGQLDEAEANFRAALAMYGQDPSELCEQSEIFSDLAYLNEMRGDVAASLPLYQRSYDGYKTCSGAQSKGALTGQEFEAGALIKLGRAAEALSIMEATIGEWRKMEAGSPDLSEPLYFLSLAYVKTAHFPQAEQIAKEMIDIQTGKVAPTDRRFGAAHMVWAEGLVGEQRYIEALPHAEIADRLLAAGAVSPGAKKAGAEARELLLTIQSKLSR